MGIRGEQPHHVGLQPLDIAAGYSVVTHSEARQVVLSVLLIDRPATARRGAKSRQRGVGRLAERVPRLTNFVRLSPHCSSCAPQDTLTRGLLEPALIRHFLAPGNGAQRAAVRSRAKCGSKGSSLDLNSLHIPMNRLLHGRSSVPFRGSGNNLCCLFQRLASARLCAVAISCSYRCVSDVSFATMSLRKSTTSLAVLQYMEAE